MHLLTQENGEMIKFGPGFGFALIYLITFASIVYVNHQISQEDGNEKSAFILSLFVLGLCVTFVYFINFYLTNKILILSFCYVMYIFIGLILPSVMIHRNPLMKAFLKSHFLDNFIIVNE